MIKRGDIYFIRDTRQSIGSEQKADRPAVIVSNDANNNHKCAKYYTIEQDGLAQSWAGETVFCNPPYSRKTKTNAGQIAWVQKCYKEATEGGSSWLCLYPPEQIRSCFTITF